MYAALKLSLLLLLLVSGSCGNHAAPTVLQEKGLQPSPTVSPTPPTDVPEKGSIRSIDFANFTYDWYPRWDQMLSKATHFTLYDGKLEVNAPRNSNEPVLFQLLNVQYGDISQDGLEEAIVTVKMSVIGNAKPYVVFVITLEDGKAKKLWAHETGDRADEGLRNVYLADGQLLVIEQYNANEVSAANEEKMTVGMCCPATFTRKFYRWHEGRFQTLRQEIVKNDYPDARVLVGRERSKS